MNLKFSLISSFALFALLFVDFSSAFELTPGAGQLKAQRKITCSTIDLSLIHISEPTRPY